MPCFVSIVFMEVSLSWFDWDWFGVKVVLHWWQDEIDFCGNLSECSGEDSYSRVKSDHTNLPCFVSIVFMEVSLSWFDWDWFGVKVVLHWWQDEIDFCGNLSECSGEDSYSRVKSDHTILPCFVSIAFMASLIWLRLIWCQGNSALTTGWNRLLWESLWVFRWGFL